MYVCVPSGVYHVCLMNEMEKFSQLRFYFPSSAHMQFYLHILRTESVVNCPTLVVNSQISRDIWNCEWYHVWTHVWF